ncbi:MAG: efflux RND transporter periplasmic adaptor subunit [Clostridia bacterium]|nr:efflux RND transporter periplasmic adaptor subunit [Clostridia bacterium]
MKKITSICLIFTLIFVFCSCGKEEKKEEKTATNVTVFVADKMDIGSTVKYTGEIKETELSSVSPKTSGTVDNLYCDIGDYVSKGQILATLDDTNYRLAYNQALAAYNSALAAYKSTTNGSVKQSENQLSSAVSAARIEYNNALDNYNRQKALYEAGAISKVAFESAQTRFDNAELNLKSAESSYNITINEVNIDTKESAQASVDSAKAALDSALNNLSNTDVVAPISGYIASRNANIGQMASQGVEMFVIKNSDEVYAELNVTESVIPYISIGTEAEISVDSADISNIKGNVTEVNTVKNDRTGMYTVRVRINNPENKLKVGMFADVTLLTKSVHDAVVVPSDSIIQLDDEKYVYVVNGDLAEKRIIKTGIDNNEYTEIISGLKSGDKVIVTGKEFISEKNNKIKIVKK